MAAREIRGAREVAATDVGTEAINYQVVATGGFLVPYGEACDHEEEVRA